MSIDAAPLTLRQREVVQLIASGLSNQEVAGRLGISERTVRAHCDALRRKLHCERRRHIPLAYREATGSDPMSAGEASLDRGGVRVPDAPTR
jgi:DNA-binding CsgD family transcriptional regulator